MLTLLLITIITFFVNGCDNLDKKEIETVNDNAAVGIYDSRCIAIAYYNSNMNAEYMDLLSERYKNADNKTKKTLEKIANNKQKKAHLQAFSTEEVDDLLMLVQDEIETIKAKHDLAKIESKWQYKGNPDKTIDITDELVELYNPSDKTRKTIEQMKNIKPRPRWEVKIHEIFGSI